MALFELKQDCGAPEGELKALTFRDCVAADIGNVFFNGGEHAAMREVDGKEALVIFEECTLKQHSAHWEAGAKQNFDTGLYDAWDVLYIQSKDYGPKPKVGKQLVLSVGEGKTRTYEIKMCKEEMGVFRMSLERVRQ